jgi:PAS domain S-box-containing protein
MNYKLEEIINIPLLQDLQEKLNLVYSFPSAIIDNEGKILTAVAWQDVCTQFHRKNTECEKECIKSDQYILEHLQDANPVVSYICPHGLVDNATPIIIEGKHLGNFFTGQFFLEEPDLEFFRKQAEKYGFDEKEYLKAVKKVPIWTKEKLNLYLDFIKSFIQIIADLGLTNLRGIETNKEIKEKDERNNAIILCTSDWIWEIDENGNYSYCSEKTEQILGYSPDEIIGKSPFDFMPQDERERVGKIFQELRTSNASIVDLENWNLHKDGHSVCLLTNGVPILDENGNIKGYRGADKDITERKLAEAELHESKQIVADIINTIPARVFWKDKNLIYQGCNLAFAEDAGFSDPKEIIGKDDYQLKWKDLAEMYRNDDIEVIKSGSKKLNIEEPLSTADGKTITLLTNKTPLRNAQGEITGVLGTFMDITERKQTEDTLRLRETYLSAIIENQNGLLWLKDINGKFLAVNKHFATSCNISDSELIIGKTDFDIWPEELAAKYAADDNKVIESKESYSIEELISEKGKNKWFETYKAPIIDKNGIVIGTTGYALDITDRKNNEEKIREKDLEFRKLSANVPDMIYQFTRKPDGTYCVPIASEGIKNIFGCTPEDVINDFTPITNVIHPEDADRVLKDIEFSAIHLSNFTCEFRVQLPDKGIQWIYSKATPEKLPDGSITWYGFNVNITKQKQVENELWESKERFKALHNASFGGIAIHDKGIILECNQGLMELTGYTFDELIGMDGLLLIAPNTRDLVLNNILSGNEKSYEALGERKNGEIYPLRLEARNIPYKGKIVRTVEFRDITESKKAEEKLITSDRIFNHSVDMFCVAGFDGYFKVLNPAWNKTLGWSTEEMLSKPWNEFVHPDDLESTNNVKTIIVEGQEIYQFENRYLCKDGSSKWLLWSSYPYKEENIMFGVARDITERKIFEMELINAKEKAQESERLKSAFLANMSHEIRTPMNGILGFADLLKDPELSGEQQQQYIRIIERSGARMLNIINDIIDISKIEAGLMKVDLKESNINDQIDYIYTFFKPEVEAKGMQLLLNNTLPAKEAIIITDREKVFAILTNLVKNAIKYTINGKIEIGYNLIETSNTETTNSVSEGEKIYLQFYVKDSGIGIPIERQQAIFERFIQADIADSKAMEGAGLGLAITKAYTEMLGGKIWVESEEGVGSTFYFTLPYSSKQLEKTAINNTLSSENESTIHDPKVSGLKILIAEDDEISELFITTIIKNISKEILKTRNGIEAIEICRNNPDIDLILMDIKMPEISGYEATRQIRQFNKDVIIIAQTAFGLTGDREKAMEAGCNDYITKPIKKNLLIEKLNNYFK